MKKFQMYMLGMSCNRVKWAEVALLFGLAFVMLLPVRLTGLIIFDEGSIVTDSNLVRLGALPYRDFISNYGPAQYYLTAFLYSIFGSNLLVSRLADISTFACLLVLVFHISVTQCGGRDRWLAWTITLICACFIVVSNPSASYPAVTATVFLLGAAVFCSGWNPGSTVRDLIVSSFFIALAGLFRWDFGLIGLIALTMGTVTILLFRRAPRLHWRHAILASILPGFTTMLLVYVPLIAHADPLRWYHEVFYYSLVDFPKYRNLFYAKPYMSELLKALRIFNLRGISVPLNRLIFLFLPISLPLLVLVGTVYVFWVGPRKGPAESPHLQSMYLALLCVGLLNQMRVRPTLWQGLPSAIIAPILLPAVARCIDWRNLLGKNIIRTGALIVLLGFAAAQMVTLVQRIRHFMDHRNFVDLDLPRATAVKVAPELKNYYPQLITFIASKTDPQEAIYSGVTDHTRFRFNDSMLYFLSNRRPANRFIELCPGVANTAAAQSEIVRSLTNVHLVVLLSDPDNHEPNLSSVSNHIYILDGFIRSHFRCTAEFGPYAVYESR